MQMDADAVRIDRELLDREWLKQPVLMFGASTILAELRQRVDHLKMELEVLECEIDAEVRSDPESFDIAKVSEKAIEKVVRTHPRVRAAAKRLSDARFEQDKAQAFLSALDHRKRALEKLVDLYLAGYFSEAKTSSAGNELLHDMGRSRPKGVKPKK